MSEREKTRRVLRRCPDCRLLFEVPEGINECVVCGVAIAGLALPIAATESVPSELAEREPTARLDVSRS